MKEEAEALNEKLSALTEDELAHVTGGGALERREAEYPEKIIIKPDP